MRARAQPGEPSSQPFGYNQWDTLSSRIPAHRTELVEISFSPMRSDFQIPRQFTPTHSDESARPCLHDQ